MKSNNRLNGAQPTKPSTPANAEQEHGTFVVELGVPNVLKGEGPGVNGKPDSAHILAMRNWARHNYTPFAVINGRWHPVVQTECVSMNIRCIMNARRVDDLSEVLGDLEVHQTLEACKGE